MQNSEALRNSLADAYDAAVNTGDATATPQIILQNAGSTALITFDLDTATAFGDASAGVITLTTGSPGIVSSSATGSDTIDHAVINAATGTTMSTLGVGTASTPDLLLSSFTLASAETMTLTAFTVEVLEGTLETA